MRLSQRMLCEQAGYRVVEVGDAAAAAACDIGSPGRRVIIADIELGRGRLGVDLARAVMQRAGMSIPTMILSGSLIRAGHEEAARGMTVRYKPASADELLHWIANALASPDDTP